MARSTKSSGTRQSGRGSAQGMSATQLLRKDHQTVKQLMQKFEKAGDRAKETKQKLFSEIERELEAHATIEEEIFYPAVQDEAPGATDLVQEAIEEHNVVKSLLREIGAMSPEDEQYDAKMKVLKENVEHHIEEEEGQMFPKAEQLAEERLQELGAEMQARKEALAQPALKRIMSGVSGLIFGNGESTAESADQDQERAQARTGRGSSAPQRRGTQQARGKGHRGKAGAGRRSVAKSAVKSRGGNKRTTGRSQAQKRSSATAKKRGSGRSAESRATVQRRSTAKKRGTGASAAGRRRTSARKSATKRR